MSHKTNSGFKGAFPPVAAATASSKSFDRLGSKYLRACGPRAVPRRWVGVGHDSGNSPRATALAITCKDVIFFRGVPGIRFFMAMCADGVLLSSFATGVGHNEEALSDVRGTDRGR